jgi:hypothetical protein
MRNLLISIAVLAIAFTVYFWQELNSEKSDLQPTHLSNSQTTEQQTKSHHTRANNQQFKQDDYKADESIIELWRESEESRQVLQSNPDKLPGDLAGEAYVELNTQQLKQLQLGDAFELTVPQLGTSFAAEVDHITQHPNGDITIEANFPGMENYYSAVITLGDGNSYAQISTPDGVYLLEAQGDYAWIASRNSLVASHWSEHQDGVAIPAEPVSESELNNEDVDVEFDFVIQESSPDDKP